INGNFISEQDLKGKFTLIYFGAAHCRKDCIFFINLSPAPIYLKRNLNCWFVSIDPDHYHPCILGATGTKSQVEHMTEIYSIYTKFHDKSPEYDFYIDHSLFIYLLSPDGFSSKYFSCKQDNDLIVDEISNDVRSYLTRDNKKRFGKRLN
ncbi:hypothetical protein MXB_1595, partial [Myxobolus squamalis]